MSSRIRNSGFALPEVFFFSPLKRYNFGAALAFSVFARGSSSFADGPSICSLMSAAISRGRGSFLVFCAEEGCGTESSVTETSQHTASFTGCAFMFRPPKVGLSRYRIVDYGHVVI